MFEKSETRGIDASGYWGTTQGENGMVLYHKEPTRSAQFVKKEAWKVVEEYNPNMLLVHSRGASKGVGEPRNNINNHPFTSQDKSIGLIHNGRIDDFEYRNLKQKFIVKSQCDSEILLRIFENSYSSEVSSETDVPISIKSISNIFSLINDGHMAVAIGERKQDGGRELWLFRNQHRPLWVIDARNQLGQVFFVSDPNIWEQSLVECQLSKQLSNNYKLFELPTEEIWNFNISVTETFPKSVKRYQVQKDEPKTWTFDGKKCFIQNNFPNFEVVTQLDDYDRIIVENIPENQYDDFSLAYEQFDKKCNQLIEQINDLRLSVEHLVHEQSIDDAGFQQLLEDLEQQSRDLQSISVFIS